ncbi:MAG: glycoside hydrolase family 9 protein [Isosphaeraceae bacterium]
MSEYDVTCPARSVAFLVAGLASPAVAADGPEIVEVRPLTDRIVLVHFDEGRVIHHERGRPRSDEKVIVAPLDSAAASRPESWSITSAEDPDFRDGRHPARVGRKSKGTDFAWFADAWKDGRAVNNRPDHAKEHWLYLMLDRPLKYARYVLDSGDIAGNGRSWPFWFYEATGRSEAVHVNPIGYAPDAHQKFAYVSHWMGDAGGLDIRPYIGRRCSLYLYNGFRAGEVFSGKLALRATADRPETFHKADSPPDGNFLKADVAEFDFSAFDRPGLYWVVVEGIGQSGPFEIKPDAYRPAFRAVARGLYHNRSGIALEAPYTRFTRPAPHNPKLTPGFAGKLLYTDVRWTEWGSEGGEAKKLMAGVKGSIDSAGWYQDAGDWDSYETHLRVPQELLLAYEITPLNFRDGELNIPESGNGLPDILDEAAWLPRFCYRLRQELLAKGYGTGGIGLRIAGDAFGSDEKTLPDGTKVGQGSWEDVDRNWVASGEDPWSTYRYAGVAAHLAHCLKIAGKPDPEGVDWEAEARAAFDWARDHTRPGDDEAKHALKVPRAYASAALFRLTGDRRYEQQFARDTADITPATQLWDEIQFGPELYALPGGKAEGDPATLRRIRAALRVTAEAIVDTAGKRALRWGGNWYMPMLVGQQTTPMVTPLAVAMAVERDADPERSARYRSVLQTTCDYFLGGNALNMTWVTGLGPRHPRHVFHMDAWYNGRGEFHPGIIPYGPWRKEKDEGQGPWDAAWPHKTVYPPIDAWPGNERWFDNRCSPMNSEFTVHQNSAPAAAIFGILCAPAEDR